MYIHRSEVLGLGKSGQSESVKEGQPTMGGCTYDGRPASRMKARAAFLVRCTRAAFLCNLF